MTVQAHGAGAPEPGKPIQVYDFHRPTTLVREHARVLEMAFETFARQWGTQLTARVRVMSHVTLQRVEMQTYDEYAASLPDTTVMVLCELKGVQARAVVQFPGSAALHWVGYMLGGNGSVTAEERKFTQIEQTLVRGLMADALEDLRYSMGNLLATPMSVQSIQYNSQFAQAAPTAELMVVATFTMRVGESTTPGTVALPAQLVLPHLGEANPTVSTADAKDLVQTHVAHTPVDVAVSLNPARVTPGRVLRLAVGDLLPLPHHQSRPFNLTVDGQTLAQAAAGRNGSRLACEVVTTQENQR